MRVVVSGSTGFLGQYTVKAFAKEGHTVYALCRNKEKAKAIFNDLANIEFVDFNLVDGLNEKAKEIIDGSDVFIHAAWMGVDRDNLDNPEMQKQNVLASIKLLEDINTLHIPNFIDYGSRAEYGNLTGVLDEKLECNPANAYGKSKLEFYRFASPYCLKNNINYLHLRFFSVFGAGDHPWSLMSTLAVKIPNGEEVSLGSCVQKWNLLYIEDAMRYVLKLTDCLKQNIIKNDIINVASIDTRVLKEYIQSINALFGNKSNLKFGEFVPLKDSKMDVIPNVEKLVSFAPIKEIGFEEGFIRYVKGEI